MRSDGTAAWPEKRTDKRIIADMLKVSKAPKPSDRVVYAGQTGGLEVKTRIDGLGQALDMVLKECSRP